MARYVCPACGYTTDSPISYGMHRAYKHNPGHPYRRWLRAKQEAESGGNKVEG
jgi:hypothetical protein